MKYVWLLLFFGSISFLSIMMAKSRINFSWLKYGVLHIVFAALFLYVLHGFDIFAPWRIPINAVTVGAISVLGVPGVLLLMALKATVIV